MVEPNKIFHYTYSAAQQKEIEEIRKKYTEKPSSVESDKLEKLRRLDAGVGKKATTVSLIFGICSTLLMGFGMSLIMTDLSITFGLTNDLLWGIILGVIGMIGSIMAYPLYQFVLKKERQKIAPKILQLTEELSSK